MQFKKKKKKKSTNKSHLINIISPCLLLCFLYFNKHEKMSLKKKKVLHLNTCCQDVEAVPLPDGQRCLLALPPECTQGAGPADLPCLKLFCRFVTDRKVSFLPRSRSSF